MATIVSLEIRLSADAKELFSDTIKESQDEFTHLGIAIASGTTDYSATLGGVEEINTLFITTDQDISFRLVTGGTQIAVPAGKCNVGFGISGITSFTELLLSNASGEEANVEYFIA